MTGLPLPLVSQLDYTDRLCAPFACAVQALLGGKIELLYAADPRQFRLQDWPVGMPLCLHAYVVFPDGKVIDAEGLRSSEEMRHSFGIRKGWSFRVETDADGALLEKEFRQTATELHIKAARDLLERFRWNEGAPEATGELSRRFKEARKAQKQRAESRQDSVLHATDIGFGPP